MGEGLRAVPKWAWVAIGLPVLCGASCMGLTLLGNILLPTLFEKVDDVNREKVRQDAPRLWEIVDALSESGPEDPDDWVLPDDPWGGMYRYEPEADGRPERVVSYGADGEPGGEHADADVVLER